MRSRAFRAPGGALFLLERGEHGAPAVKVFVFRVVHVVVHLEGRAALLGRGGTGESKPIVGLDRRSSFSSVSNFVKRSGRPPGEPARDARLRTAERTIVAVCRTQAVYNPANQYRARRS